tara:strand:- start:581 stop:2047 length:1467 start_codon:yes stop_codon:yes gene_type:complete
MSVSSTTTKNSHSGNGSTTAFAYSFKIFADTDLLVIIRASTGAETTKSLSTHYTVSGAGAESGGTVTFTSGNTPASGETVVIRRNLGLTQATDYVENDPFPAESHEDALDRLTFITQGIQEELDRSFKVSKTNSITTPEFVDDASTRASKLLGFSSSGNNLEATTGRVSSVSVSNVAVSSGASQAATVSFNTTSGALALGIPVGSTGATGATGAAGDLSDPTTTQHDIIVRGASAVERLAKGSNSTVLNTNASGALAYSTVSTAMIADDAVATAKIADNAVSLAKLAGIARGKIIVGDASGNPSVLAAGSNGHALVSDGTDVGFAAVGGGKILQVVTTQLDTTGSFSSSSTSDYADISGLAVAITPAATSSKILIFVNTVLASSVFATIHTSLFRGSTKLGAANVSSRVGGSMVNLSSNQAIYALEQHGFSFHYLDSPSTTDATTYQLKATLGASYNGSLFFNRTVNDTDADYGARSRSVITAVEVGA